MNLLCSKLSDVPFIMGIINDAQKYLASLNIDQWQDGYPDETQIKLDIKNNDSYLVLIESNQIIGTTVFTIKKEPTYQNIDGNWITPEDAKYGVIHRLAVGDDYRKLGLAKFVFSEFSGSFVSEFLKLLVLTEELLRKLLEELLEFPSGFLSLVVSTML